MLVSSSVRTLRLSHSLLLSSALHLAVALATRSPLARLEAMALRSIPAAAPALLQVSLRTAAGTLPLTIAPAAAQPSPPAAAPPAPGTSPAGAKNPAAESGATAIQPARFLVEPDLSVLETFAVIGSGKIRLALAVSPLGRVDGVRILASDPVPEALLIAIQQRLKETGLEPARDANGRAVRSELLLTIGFEPGVELLDRDR